MFKAILSVLRGYKDYHSQLAKEKLEREYFQSVCKIHLDAAAHSEECFQEALEHLAHAVTQLALDAPLAEAARAYAKLELVGPGPDGHDAAGFGRKYVDAQMRIIEIYCEQMSAEERAKLPTPPFAQAEFSRLDDDQLNTIDHLNRDAPLAEEARAHYKRMNGTCGCGPCEYIKKKEQNNG